ncbi:hypothetical protein EV426DRAFT_578264 [Tirmania nivea]|nr:hypothetical protein EV426DRAFT_578264 [Tirmania nivea]
MSEDAGASSQAGPSRSTRTRATALPTTPSLSLPLPSTSSQRMSTLTTSKPMKVALASLAPTTKTGPTSDDPKGQKSICVQPALLCNQTVVRHDAILTTPQPCRSAKVKCREVKKQKQRTASAKDSGHEYHKIELNFGIAQEGLDWIEHYQLKKDPKNFYYAVQKRFRLKKPNRVRKIDKTACLKKKAKDLFHLNNEGEKKADERLKLWKEYYKKARVHTF